MEQSFLVHKATRINTVSVTFSHLRFKTFVYKARKKLKTEQNPISTDLYLNDNLTSYNFGILRNLKNIRVKRTGERKPVFESVYSIHGKIFVKMLKTMIQ